MRLAAADVQSVEEKSINLTSVRANFVHCVLLRMYTGVIQKVPASSTSKRTRTKTVPASATGTLHITSDLGVNRRSLR
jgi:hypothetical protein